MKKILLLHISMFLMVICAFSQEFSVNFTGRLNGSQYQRLDSVKITDVTRNWTETLVYPDTVIVVNATVNVSDAEMSAVGFEQNVPNPFDCYTSVNLAIPQDENVRLLLYDASGKQCAELNVALNTGSHRFDITASKPQAYILKAVAGAKIYSVRMINVGSCGSDGIKYGGYAGLCTKLTIENEFQVGDNMEYVGYATIAGNVVESEIVSMQLRQSQDVVLEFRSETVGMLNGHEWVDLGLPGGLLWATCNVGATNPEDYGDYFAWGETTPKEYYDWTTYLYCNGSETTLTKYCDNADYGNNGFTDTLTTLEAIDDAATANWGNGWRMPTDHEIYELYTNCTVAWTTHNGVNCEKFTGPNGNSIFLPAAGYSYHGGLGAIGLTGYYWSSSISFMSPYYPGDAWYLLFDSDHCSKSYYLRYYGNTVRPVLSRANDNDSITVSVPTVITGTASDITAYGATFYGDVISDGGATVTDRGFVYGTSANNLTQSMQCGCGTGIFVNTIGLDPVTTYYYKAYATNSIGTAYGEVMSFTTENVGDPTGTLNGHDWVDLGLPSGTRWATCNVGSTTPEGYGDYFAWGETSTKTIYTEDNYTYTGNPITLPTSADAATANWGNGWRMPTREEMDELYRNCTREWTTQNDVNGEKFIGPNGNSIFLPAAGYRHDGDLDNASSRGYYWLSSLSTNYSRYAFNFIFDSGNCDLYNGSRVNGLSVRPVCDQ